MPSIPALTDPLTDGGVTVRAPSERDIPEILIAYQDDPELHVRLGQERPPSGAELGRECERAEEERRAGQRVAFTILETGADDCRGRVVAHDFSWDARRAELDIWIAPQFRNRGLARGALRLSAGWLFASCGLERLQLLTEPDHTPMLRAAQAAGFVHEGVLRGHTGDPGRREDEAILSLLADDLRG